MTQENKLQRIDELSEQLAEECEKLGLTFVLGVNIDYETIFVSSAGDPVELFECLNVMEEHFEDETGMEFDVLKKTMNDECDCSGCKARRGEVETEKVPDDVLAKFLTALFSVSKEGGLND
ncbi:hypothetical protein [Vagococcus fluvialis]|uniref:hypothetical protein n=1 Tax=Vagococcus fluvialis TaxID=2738 RepID=UPI002B294721|nr:hypothetical protein QDW48_06325 [Vagococcus fluvialis]